MIALGRILRTIADRARPGRGDDALEALLVRQLEQDAGEGRVVLDDQHERLAVELVAVVAAGHSWSTSAVSAGPASRQRRNRQRPAERLWRHVEGEGRTLARRPSGPAARRRAGGRSRG